MNIFCTECHSHDLSYLAPSSQGIGKYDDLLAKLSPLAMASACGSLAKSLKIPYHYGVVFGATAGCLLTVFVEARNHIVPAPTRCQCNECGYIFVVHDHK